MNFGRKWGPFLCILAALFLCMADLTRHLVNDAWGTACDSLDRDGRPSSVLGVRDSPGGAWEALGAKYTKYCYSRSVADQYIREGVLSVWGWTFAVLCTWSGFVLLFVGIVWVLNLPGKVVAQWNSIRGRRPAQLRDVAARPGGQQLLAAAA